jgi:hypothetical protein
MTRRKRLAVTGVAVLIGVAVVAVALDVHAVRVSAAVLGCLVLPGLGWARRLQLRDLGDTIALTVVLSLTSTAIVATGMAVAGWWSPVAGLVCLAGVAALGFVPVRHVLEQARFVLLGGPEPDSDEDRRRRAAEVRAAEEEWKDWYADARRRSDEERALQAAAAEAAAREWRDWYAKRRRAAAEHRSRRWQQAEAPGEDETDLPRTGSRTEIDGDPAPTEEEVVSHR